MSDTIRETTLAVLAGGEGLRMGRPKGNLCVGGHPILQHIIEAARWPGPTLLVTAPGREHPPGADAFDAEAIDPEPGLGPMRGVLTALEHATTDTVVIAPVDMPSAIVMYRWLAEAMHRRPGAMMLMMRRDGNDGPMIEPLPAAIRRSAAAMIRRQIEEGRRSLHRLADVHGVETIDAPTDWPRVVWANINSPKDFAAWEGWIADAGR